MEINLQHGDSLIGLPFDKASYELVNEHNDKLQELSDLREHYIDDHMRENAATELVNLQNDLRKDLDRTFEDFTESNSDLDSNVADETIPSIGHSGFSRLHR